MAHVEITLHVAERYVERVKPHLTVADANRELAALLASGRRVERVPWVIADEFDQDFYVELSDGIVCPVLGGRALTVLTRGSVGAHARAGRNKRRTWRRGLSRLGTDTKVRRREDKRQRAKSRRWDTAA